jgi:hypothetical protein
MSGKHPDIASEFSPDEFEAVCHAADKVVVHRGGRGWSAKPDPDFAGEVVRVLGRTGIHPSKIGWLGPQNLQDDVLSWHRTKPRPGRRLGKKVWVPVHHELLGLLPRFLAKEKPKTKWSYEDILQRVERQVLEDEGLAVHVNALRFRYFAARTFLEMGLDAVEVCQMLGTSLQTLSDHYGRTSPEALKDKLRGLAW